MDRRLDGPLHRVSAAAVEEGGGDEESLEALDDLELWPAEWRMPTRRRVLTSYHKEGAPYAEADADDTATSSEDAAPAPLGLSRKRPPRAAAMRPTSLPPAPAAEVRTKARPRLGAAVARRDGRSLKQEGAITKRRPKRRTSGAEEGRASADGGGLPPQGEQDGQRVTTSVSPPGARLHRVIDLPMIEVLAYTAMKAVFRDGVRFNVKREKLIDWEVVIKDRLVLLDAQRVEFQLPELSVWTLVFAYRGKPLVELGRGVPGGVRVFRLRLLLLYLRLWWDRTIRHWRRRRGV